MDQTAFYKHGNMIGGWGCSSSCCNDYVLPLSCDLCGGTPAVMTIEKNFPLKPDEREDTKSLKLCLACYNGRKAVLVFLKKPPSQKSEDRMVDIENLVGKIISMSRTVFDVYKV